MTLTALRPTQETIDLVAGLRGKWHGSYAMCRCPAHSDSEPSLSIRQGQKGILVHCFAGCKNEDVLRELSRTTPLLNSSPPDYRPNAGRGNARRLWEQARDIRGTLGETYLRARHIGDRLDDLRFHPRCPFGRKPNTVFRPAVIVALRDGIHFKAIQRIALASDGTAHRGKIMLGRPGAASWSPDFRGSRLAIAESMEDASAYTRLTGIPGWSSLGAQRLPLVRIPNSVTELIIAEDNNLAGRNAAVAAVEAHRRAGRIVKRHKPPQGCTDWSGYLDHVSRNERA